MWNFCAPCLTTQWYLRSWTVSLDSCTLLWWLATCAYKHLNSSSSSHEIALYFSHNVYESFSERAKQLFSRENIIPCHIIPHLQYYRRNPSLSTNTKINSWMSCFEKHIVASLHIIEQLLFLCRNGKTISSYQTFFTIWQLRQNSCP